MDTRILLTGASGYVGGRLLRHFEDSGVAVRCLARDPAKLAPERPTTEVVAGDCLSESSLPPALAGIDTAYYLVHSLAAGSRYAELDRQAADNFGRAASQAGVRRIVYLGGLTGADRATSAHLQSRAETGDVLRASGVPVVEFRASIVIGAGSLSFQMIRVLVERLPVMLCPRWVQTRTQPIAIDDVVAYLAAALDLPHGEGRIVEIGGPDTMSYGDILRAYARQRGLRRLLIPVPVLTPRLSGLWLALVTPAQARVGRALIDGLRTATTVRSTAALDTFAIRPMPLQEAFRRAIVNDVARLKTDTREVVVDVPPAQAFAPVRGIGGTTGWYFANSIWRLRGFADRCMGGTGMSSGRRNQDECAVGDVIDGWTVESYEPDRRLLLLAGMKLPGRGWLEFDVTPVDGGRRSRIRQRAIFDPRGIGGRLYWLSVLPVHLVLFRGLLRRIAQHAARGQPRTPAVRPGAQLRRTASVLAFALAVATAAAAQTGSSNARQAEVRTVARVDLERYLGDWFEIARFPNRFQRQCTGDVRASYARRPDGRIDVINRCGTADGVNEARGVARIVDPTTSARLEVRFAPAVLSLLPFVWGDYWVLGLADDYSWATVGAPNRDYLWILSRTPALDEAGYAAALEAARVNGFEVERLVKTAQSGANAQPR